MKRDMDLIRQVLLEMEKQSFEDSGTFLKFDGYSDEEVSYQVMLLDEAGLIQAQNLSGGSDLVWVPMRLTWQGHEFLDAARDDTRWNKAKDAMAKAGGFVFEVAKSLLIDYMKQQLSAPKP